MGIPRVLETVGILALVLCSCSDFVFIHMESSPYSLPCSPVELEVADLTYHWVQDRADPKLLPVTKEGHLFFQHFQAGDSGKYSCSISYTKHGVPVSQMFHYHIFGYHVLGGLDTVLLFHSKFCKDEWTKRLLWDLQKNLRQLEIQQHCKVQLTDNFCFPSLSNVSDQFIVQVQLEVSPFGPHWDENCSPLDMETITDCYQHTVQHNLRQVQLALTRFFKEHKSFHITGDGIPSIDFTSDFVGILKTKECSGGYGQTKQLQRCLSCCIVCPPGTFSPPKNNQCSPCPVGTYSPIYGVAFCTPCKDGMITKVPGASSMTDCIKKGRTKQVALIVHRIPELIVTILTALLAMNFLFIFCSSYWFCREYRMSSPRASKKTGSTTRMETEPSFSKISRQDSQAGLDAGCASDTSHPDSSASQGDEKHVHRAPPLAATPNLAAVTDEMTLTLTLEEGKGNF